jgi:hypothetical protein
MRKRCKVAEGGSRILKAGVVCALFALAGCGRYRLPLQPELLAPDGVLNLVVQPADTSVAFSWIAADVDRRGKELKSAEGFIIERKELIARGDETDPEVTFDKIGFLKDRHVEVRDTLRKEARAAGKIGRTVESPEQYTTFSFADSTPVKGRTYLYQIVPVNQGGTRGKVGQLAKVVFQGQQSAVVIVASKEAEDALLMEGQPVS